MDPVAERPIAEPSRRSITAPHAVAAPHAVPVPSDLLPPPPRRAEPGGPRHEITHPLRPMPAAPPLAPVLLVEGGAPLGLAVPIGPTTVTLGRGAGLTIVLDDRSVSRVHAGVALRDGRVEVQDFGSTNGSFLDGRRVTFAEARDGSTLRLGDTALRIFLRPRSRSALERARLQLSMWRTGIDPVTRLPHGGALRLTLERACLEAEAARTDVCLVFADVARPSRRVGRRLRSALRPGMTGWRHGTHRLAALADGEAPPDVAAIAARVGAYAAGSARASEVGFDPDRLVLAAAARVGAAGLQRVQSAR